MQCAFYINTYLYNIFPRFDVSKVGGWVWKRNLKLTFLMATWVLDAMPYPSKHAIKSVPVFCNWTDSTRLLKCTVFILLTKK